MRGERDIAYETADGTHWVKRLETGGFEVYRAGATHSVRVASIGAGPRHGLRRAIVEADKRAVVTPTIGAKPHQNPKI